MTGPDHGRERLFPLRTVGGFTAERPDAPALGKAKRCCDRFGAGTVTRAALLHRGEGLSVPLLPD